MSASLMVEVTLYALPGVLSTWHNRSSFTHTVAESIGRLGERTVSGFSMPMEIYWMLVNVGLPRTLYVELGGPPGTAFRTTEFICAESLPCLIAVRSENTMSMLF